MFLGLGICQLEIKYLLRLSVKTNHRSHQLPSQRSLVLLLFPSICWLAPGSSGFFSLESHIPNPMAQAGLMYYRSDTIYIYLHEWTESVLGLVVETMSFNQLIKR